MLIRHATANMLSGPAILPILAGQWAALMLRIDGSTGAAAPVVGDFGLIRGRIDSRPFYSVTWSATQEINRMDLGQVEAAIGAFGGNPIDHSCMIISSRTGDGNIFDIDDDDDSAIEVDLSGIAAGNLASGTIQLYGIPQEGVQFYIPNMFTRQPNIAASSTDVVRFKEENVSHLYMVTLTNLDRALLIKDGEVKANAEFAALLAASNMDARLEAAFTTSLRLDLHKSGALTEAMSDKFELTLTTNAGGVGNPELVPVALDFTPDALLRSTSLVEAKAAMVLQRKAESGKARAVTVVEALTGGVGAI
jgi:hypothetical protein